MAGSRRGGGAGTLIRRDMKWQRVKETFKGHYGFAADGKAERSGLEQLAYGQVVIAEIKLKN